MSAKYTMPRDERGDLLDREEERAARDVARDLAALHTAVHATSGPDAAGAPSASSMRSRWPRRCAKMGHIRGQRTIAGEDAGHVGMRGIVAVHGRERRAAHVGRHHEDAGIEQEHILAEAVIGEVRALARERGGIEPTAALRRTECRAHGVARLRRAPPESRHRRIEEREVVAPGTHG
jgi:hypothetical protein